jgi:hypothetical protein
MVLYMQGMTRMLYTNQLSSISYALQCCNVLARSGNQTPDRTMTSYKSVGPDLFWDTGYRSVPLARETSNVVHTSADTTTTNLTSNPTIVQESF